MSDDAGGEEQEEKVISPEEVRAIALTSWYPQFEADTLKTRFIELSAEFLAYLRADGMLLPASVNTLKRAADDDYGALTDDWDDYESDEDPEDQCPEFPEIQQQISDVIAEFGAVLPKSNWTAPKDAIWILPNRSLRCGCLEDVFLLVKASQRLGVDFSDWHDLGVAPAVLALRKWYAVEQSMEFRCFVVDGRLTGISQKNCTERFEHLGPVQDVLRETICAFWGRVLQDKFALPTYTVDVYVQPKAQAPRQFRTFIVSFGIFGVADESPCLFEWQELQKLAADASRPGNLPPLRIVDTQHMTPSDSSYNAMPHDLRTADFQELLEQLKERTEGRTDQENGEEGDGERNLNSK